MSRRLLMDWTLPSTMSTPRMWDRLSFMTSAERTSTTIWQLWISSSRVTGWRTMPEKITSNRMLNKRAWQAHLRTAILSFYALSLIRMMVLWTWSTMKEKLNKCAQQAHLRTSILNFYALSLILMSPIISVDVNHHDRRSFYAKLWLNTLFLTSAKQISVWGKYEHDYFW